MITVNTGDGIFREGGLTLISPDSARLAVHVQMPISGVGMAISLTKGQARRAAIAMLAWAEQAKPSEGEAY